MNFKVFFSIPLGTTLVFGCSIRPDPKDVTNLDPFEIHKQIRCEAQRAIQNKAIALLRDSGVDSMYALSQELDADRQKFRTFLKRRFHPAVGHFVNKYAKEPLNKSLFEIRSSIL